jgi:hypothetical protein
MVPPPKLPPTSYKGWRKVTIGDTLQDGTWMIKLKPSTNNSENTAKVTAGHLFNIITLASLI